MNIIIDSTVIIAAFSAHGLCESLFEMLLENHTVIVSDYILTEVERILLKKFKMPKEDVADVISFLKDFTAVSVSEELPDPVLGISHCVEADYLLTGDRGLLVLGMYNKVKIVSPRDLWVLVSKESQRQL
jgi:predicted nucleic acid-binding protein